MSTQIAIQKSFLCLDSVYINGAFGNVTLNTVLNKTPNQDKALVTKIVYGVLDNDLWLDFCVRKFATKVDSSVLVLLKIGAYCITKLNLPSAVAVNDCVEVLKRQGKKGLSGFVNAVLRNISRAYEKDDFVLPDDNMQAISIKHSLPLWALQKLKATVGEQLAIDFACFKPTPQTTVRINEKINSVKEVQAFLDANDIRWQQTFLPDALSVVGDTTLLTENTACTPMSLSAMLVVRALEAKDGEKILDCCSAPGGKSVYIANLCPKADITSCDIYPHKLKLIEGYAKKMGASNINVLLNDATVSNKNFIDKFDKVLLDAPCSGFGVLQSRPDIKVFRKKQDVTELAKIQWKMLCVAKDYVKKGGNLLYSTCTVFEEENSKNIARFLNENHDFELLDLNVGLKTALPNKLGFQLLPNVHGIDGFYIAKLKRKI